MSSYILPGWWLWNPFWELCALTVMDSGVCLGSMSGFIVLISTGGCGGGVGVGGGARPNKRKTLASYIDLCTLQTRLHFPP